MVIRYSSRFISDLEKIVDYISLDSPNRAQKFLNELKQEIYKIPFMPYRFRKNSLKNIENIRDLIFKGYVIPFEISENSIEILIIFKSNNPIYQNDN